MAASVAFESLARLVPADTDDRADIYVLDRGSGRVTLESATPDADSEHTVAANQRRRTLRRLRRYGPAEATRPSPRTDIVLHDRVAGTSRVLTAAAEGDPYAWSRSPDISDDGRVVAFSSAATTLTAGPDVNGKLEDIYLVRLPGGTVSRASVTSAGVQPGRGNSILPSLSADGRWLAFASTAPLDEPSVAIGAEPRARGAPDLHPRRDRRTDHARHTSAESRRSEWRQLAAVDQRRRAIRRVCVGGVEPPRRRRQPCVRCPALRSRHRCPHLGQPRRRRIVSRRREHWTGDLRRRPVRGVSVGCVQPRVQPDAAAAVAAQQRAASRARRRTPTPRTSTCCGTCSSSIPPAVRSSA